MNPCNVFQIVHDPAPDGFRPGAQLIGAGETLKQGNFTPGTIVLAQGRRYIVQGQPGRPQSLMVRR